MKETLVKGFDGKFHRGKLRSPPVPAEQGWTWAAPAVPWAAPEEVPGATSPAAEAQEPPALRQKPRSLLSLGRLFQPAGDSCPWAVSSPAGEEQRNPEQRPQGCVARGAGQR